MMQPYLKVYKQLETMLGPTDAAKCLDSSPGAGLYDKVYMIIAGELPAAAPNHFATKQHQFSRRLFNRLGLALANEFQFQKQPDVMGGHWAFGGSPSVQIKGASLFVCESRLTLGNDDDHARGRGNPFTKAKLSRFAVNSLDTLGFWREIGRPKRTFGANHLLGCLCTSPIPGVQPLFITGSELVQAYKTTGREGRILRLQKQGTHKSLIYHKTLRKKVLKVLMNANERKLA